MYDLKYDDVIVFCGRYVHIPVRSVQIDIDITTNLKLYR